MSVASPQGFAFGFANARGINGAGRPHLLAKHTVGGGGRSSNSIVAMMVVVGAHNPLPTTSMLVDIFTTRALGGRGDNGVQTDFNQSTSPKFNDLMASFNCSK